MSTKHGDKSSRLLRSRASYLFLAFLMNIVSCAIAQKPASSLASANEVPHFTVEEATDWTNLFYREKGWFGGDGIFFIPMDGKRNQNHSTSVDQLVLFSDSMIGDAILGRTQGNNKMVHNAVAMLKGSAPKEEKIQFYWDSTSNGKPETMFIPSTPSAIPSNYYWLGDGLFNYLTGETYVFGYKMLNVESTNDWSFTLTKTNLIILPKGSKPPYTNQKQIETPFSFINAADGENGSFGSGIFVSTKQAGLTNYDNYVYVYGIKGKQKKLLVARVTMEQFLEFDKWTFWNGSSWTSNMLDAAPICDGVSDEMSVSQRKDGKYVMIFQRGGLSPKIGMRIGDSPYGPFSDVIDIYTCPIGATNKNQFAYNAKAHPSISKNGELIISYNVNAFDFDNELLKEPQLYRPRFIRLKW